MTDSRLVWDTWPQDVSWERVSPQLLYIWLISLVIYGLPTAVIAGGAVWMWWGYQPGLWLGGVIVAALGLRAVLLRRVLRSWGYAERDDDLLIRHGVWTKRLSIVPYGRMQFIDVSAGPLERMFGLATVKLHTAAATTDSTVPGLPPEAAAGLRDRLAERATAEREGL